MSWIDQLWFAHLYDLKRLRALDSNTRVECRMCGGSAHPECGCDGTSSAAEAIAYVEFELEILAK